MVKKWLISQEELSRIINSAPHLRAFEAYIVKAFITNGKDYEYEVLSSKDLGVKVYKDGKELRTENILVMKEAKK